MKKLNIIFMLLIVPICTMAQERLTLDECLELAKSHNKRIEASNFQIESAKYEKRATLSNYFPTVALTGGSLYSTAEGTLGMEGGLLPVVGMDEAGSRYRYGSYPVQ